jgi:hypothetical protein
MKKDYEDLQALQTALKLILAFWKMTVNWILILK